MCLMITWTIFTDSTYFPMLKSYPTDAWEVVTKFICAMILHVKL